MSRITQMIKNKLKKYHLMLTFIFFNAIFDL
jgi:hypothetical protein